MSESLKKVTLFCKLGSEKVLKDNVLLKEIPRAYLRPFCFPEVRSGGYIRIFFSVFRWLLLLFFVFFFCFVFLFCSFFYFCFVFVPRGKSSVSSLGCSCCCCFFFLNFLLGCLLHSGCSFIHVFRVRQCGV